MRKAMILTALAVAVVAALALYAGRWLIGAEATSVMLWRIGDVESVDPSTGQLTAYADEFNFPGDVLPPGGWPPFTNPFVVGTTPTKEFPGNSNKSANYATDFRVQWYGALRCGGVLTLSWSPGKSATETKIITSIDTSEAGTFVARGSTDPTGWKGYPLVQSTLVLSPIPHGWHEFRFQHTTGDGTIWDWVRLEASECNVSIDIKPGSDPNCFKNDDHGVIPVAILSSATFDATTVDPATVQLGSLPVKMAGKSGKYLAHAEDVNGDGLTDLVVQILDDDSLVITGSGQATLVGATPGFPISGTDSVCIVP